MPETPPPARKIIHIDMDCFYAAVEMRERPELAGKPIAVGGGSRRGVICTCNYEARKFGVRSAMPGFMARERCPQLVFLPVRFELYRADSSSIRAILREYTPLVEPLSLDEAYLDVTGAERYAWDIAREIRKRIFTETRLTASAGIAPNKMLAKIASDWRKPDNQFAVTPENVDAFMRDLPVGKLWGVGPRMREKFTALGIQTCGNLQQFTLVEMIRRFGNWGAELHQLCRGRDDRPVEPDWVRKSLSNECTYAENLSSTEQCHDALDELITELDTELRTKVPDRHVRKIFVKVKFSDFRRVTRECLSPGIDREAFHSLLDAARASNDRPIRLLGTGVRFADIQPDSEQQIDLPF